MGDRGCRYDCPLWLAHTVRCRGDPRLAREHASYESETTYQSVKSPATYMAAMTKMMWNHEYYSDQLTRAT
jgi:hypothetical protein